MIDRHKDRLTDRQRPTNRKAYEHTDTRRELDTETDRQTDREVFS